MRMNRFSVVGFSLLLICASCWAAPASTAEQVVRSYFAALQENGMASSANFMHPDELARFKEMLLPVYSAEQADSKRELLDATLGSKATLQELRSMPPDAFLRAFMTAVASRLGIGKLQFNAIDVLGSVQEGEVVHVVTRVQVGVGGLAVRQMEVVSLKPFGDTWKLLLTGQIEGVAQALRAWRPGQR